MYEFLEELLQGLKPYLVSDPHSADRGALFCPSHNDCHTRAGEAAFPFVFLGQAKARPELIEAGLALADWLVSRQEADGSWLETPLDWKATTVFQLLALAAILDRCPGRLSEARRQAYGRAALKAAAWVKAKISLRRSATNYIASAAAGFGLMDQVFPGQGFDRLARRLADQAAGRITADGLVRGEGPGGRRLGFIPVKPKGIDIGYGLEMTLASLGLAARLLGDRRLSAEVDRALAAHLYFVYPDGSLDNSLGSRGYKWTLFGSKTAHGSQMAFAFGAAGGQEEMNRAARLNLEYLRTCLSDGLLGYGPDPGATGWPPCLYPSFIRACNLAFALAYYPDDDVAEAPIPADRPVWIKDFASLNSLVVKREPWMATISGYAEELRYLPPSQDLVFRTPGGGALTYLFLGGFGPVQAASQLDYVPFERIHVPQVEPRPSSLAPRAVLLRGGSQTSNAHAHRVEIEAQDQGETVLVSARGRFADPKGGNRELAGQFAIEYRFSPQELSKTYRLSLNGSGEGFRIIEPVLVLPGTSVQAEAEGLIFSRAGRQLLVRAKAEGGEWSYGGDGEVWTSPLPALKARPLICSFNWPGQEELTASISFQAF